MDEDTVPCETRLDLAHLRGTCELPGYRRFAETPSNGSATERRLGWAESLYHSSLGMLRRIHGELPDHSKIAACTIGWKWCCCERRLRWVEVTVQCERGHLRRTCGPPLHCRLAVLPGNSSAKEERCGWVESQCHASRVKVQDQASLPAMRVGACLTSPVGD